MDNRVKIEDLKKDTQKYIAELKNLPKAEAKRKATNNLKKIGVLDSRGKVKENIVRGDFFGW